MKSYNLIIVPILLMVLISIFCTKSLKTQMLEGGLYATPTDNKDGYFIIKILKIDKDGYHIRMYSNLFKQIPNDININELYIARLKDKKENEITGVGHLPINKKQFEKYKLYFIRELMF